MYRALGSAFKAACVVKGVEIETKRRARVNNSTTNCTTPLIISSGWMNKIFQSRRNLLALRSQNSPSGKKEQSECPCTLSRSPSVRRLFLLYFAALAALTNWLNFLNLECRGPRRKKAFCANYFYHYSSGFFSGTRSILRSK